MKVRGIGIVFTRGVGMASLEQALMEGWRQPSATEDPRRPGAKHLAYLVDLDAVTDRTLLKKVRRSDKLSKMAVLAAADALRDGGMENADHGRTGVIVATAFGAHVTTFSFLDDILDYGDAAVSPTTFSNSVHNAAASYAATTLGITGPTLTVTQFRSSFPAALQLAGTWLDQKRCDRVLVGAAEQHGQVLAHVADGRLAAAPDGRIRPFLLKDTGAVPGEGAVFFLVTRDDGGSGYCGADVPPVSVGPIDADIVIPGANGMAADETACLACIHHGAQAAAYAPIFGSMMVGSAFDAAAGALMLKQQRVFAAPVRDNPHGLGLVDKTEVKDIGTIACIGCDCDGEILTIALSRS